MTPLPDLDNLNYEALCLWERFWHSDYDGTDVEPDYVYAEFHEWKDSLSLVEAEKILRGRA